MIELNKIYCEDNLITMSRMPSNFVDCVVTSPPYSNIRDYNGYAYDFEKVAKGLCRVLKPGGVIVWVENDKTIKGSRSGETFKHALYFKELGMNIHDIMLYKKNGCRFPE